MKRSRAGRGRATRRLTWFAIPMLVLAAFAGPSSVAAHAISYPSATPSASTEPSSSTEPTQSTEPTPEHRADAQRRADPEHRADAEPEHGAHPEHRADRQRRADPEHRADAEPEHGTQPEHQPVRAPDLEQRALPEDCPVITPHFSAVGTTPFCDGDVPWLDYQVAVDNTPNTSVTITFVHPTDRARTSSTPTFP